MSYVSLSSQEIEESCICMLVIGTKPVPVPCVRCYLIKYIICPKKNQWRKETNPFWENLLCNVWLKSKVSIRRRWHARVCGGGGGFIWQGVYIIATKPGQLINLAILLMPFGSICPFNLSILSVPDEGYSRNVSDILNLISTFFFNRFDCRPFPN